MIQNIFHGTAWALRVVMLGLAIRSAAVSDYLSVTKMSVFIILSFLPVLLPYIISAFLDVGLVLAHIINMNGWAWNWYDNIYLYDKGAHFFTTFILTWTVYELGRKYVPEIKTLSPRLMGISLFSIGLALGAIWEMTEWIAELFFPGAGIIGDVNDTVADLMFDGAGALLGVWFVLYVVYRLKVWIDDKDVISQSTIGYVRG